MRIVQWESEIDCETGNELAKQGGKRHMKTK